MADDTNITDHVRLKALEMLGKNLGIFETNINKNSVDLVLRRDV